MDDCCERTGTGEAAVFFDMLSKTNSEGGEFVVSPSLNPYLHGTDIPAILWGAPHAVSNLC